MILSKSDCKKLAVRYRNDPCAFISECIKVIHPIRGMVPFALYPFQRIIVKALKEKRFNILRKFRQAGITTIVAAYALWLCIFHEYKSVVILSIGDTEATEVLARIKTMYSELPQWIKDLTPVIEKNKHTLQFRNLSVIKSRPSGPQSGRGLSGSLVVFDEAAFIESMGTIWEAAYPTISTGGSVFMLSTVNGIGNFYHGAWEDAIAGKNFFHALQINYEDHPEYIFNEEYDKEYKEKTGNDFYKELKSKGIDVTKWEEITKANMSPRAWKQEYLAEFLGTGDTFVDGEILTQLHEEVNTEFRTEYSNRLRKWQEPHPMYEYLISADPSLGRERDSTAFQVFNIYDGEQVAEFKSNNIPLNQAAKILVELARAYNNAIIIPERNNIGLNLIEHIRMLDYDVIWCDEKGLPGLQINMTNREQILALMEEFVRTRKLKINSERLVIELLTFVVNDQGKAEADEGCHDDLVMSLAIACYGLKNILMSTPVESQLGDHYSISAESYSKAYKHQIPVMDGYTEEDLKWLIAK